MAFGVIEILAIIGFIVGIIVAARKKKVEVMDLLVTWGIFAIFTPAWMVITDLFGITDLYVFGNIVDPLVTYFGLGAAILFIIKYLGKIFK